jgi:hypothetical protein
VDTEFCAVAIYTANEAPGVLPSWGNHHGPLTYTVDTASGNVTLERWTPPTAPMGALTKQSMNIAAAVPMGPYFHYLQANDLPFFGWTTIPWTNPLPGGVVALSNGAVAATYTANSPYAAVGLLDGMGQGRFLYTGLSALGAPSGNTNGVYAADACSSPMQALGSGQGCSAPVLVSGWDDTPGPIAADKNGNAFAVLVSSANAVQEARGFLAANVAWGKPATPGVSLFTIPGTPGSLAAVTPTTSQPGVLVFQPYDKFTQFELDVVAQRYTVGTDVVAMGTTTTFLTVPMNNYLGLPFMTDDADRIWVAYQDAVASTTYVVLARK